VIALPSFLKEHKNSHAAVLALLWLAFLYSWVGFTAEAPAGGQDSWNHYLFARWSFKHPELILDLWGKPFFTALAAPFAQFGIKTIYFLNTTATLATAWLTYLTGRKLGMRNAWMLILLMGLQPVVLANFYSSLTEPTNALVLVWVMYLIVSHRYTAGIIVASFLPIIRTEGLVLIGALIPFLIMRGKWKHLLYLLSGTLIFALIAALISGEWNYFIAHNPYFSFEAEGKFDPGSGSFWHYIQAQKSITGIWVTILVFLSVPIVTNYIFTRYKKHTPHEMSQFMLWVALPLFGGYFFAHSFIWYAGMLGSHGLVRVFMVVSPVAAILAQYSLHKIMSLDIRFLNRGIKVVTYIISIFIAFQGAGFDVPFKGKNSIKGFPGTPQWEEAMNFIDSKGWSKYMIVHQLPEMNVLLDLDPYEPVESAIQNAGVMQGMTQYLWSLDTREGYDWFPEKTILIWDNFHARRDAPLPLYTLRSLKQYQEVAYFPSDIDTIYDVRVFRKKP